MKDYTQYAPVNNARLRAMEGSKRLILLDLFILTKPGIVSLVLVSTLSGLYFASAGSVSLSIVVKTLFGMALATSGAAVLNNYLDRDIDSLMKRTKRRALVTGTINPTHALILALTLLSSSALVLFVGVNPLSALLSATAVFIYVVLYGMILKRRSSYANQIGGLAGALPPVIGYVAVTGAISVEALAMFLIVALWQQPHALSLALKYRDDYGNADIPVVPLVIGVRATKLRIAIYALLLIPVTSLPWFLSMAGPFYLACATIAGLIFAGLAVKFLSSKREYDMRLFFYSIVYLTLVFMAMVADMRL